MDSNLQANESLTIHSANASGVGSLLYSTVSTELSFLRMLSMSANPSNDQFSVSEKVQLLVNVLQNLVPDLPSYLLRLILVDLQRDLQREPRWMDIVLPKGRTLHACQIAFEDMRRHYERHETGLTRSYTSMPYVNIAPAAPAIPPGRSFPEYDSNPTSRRPLQPRILARTTQSPIPPVTNGESPLFTRRPASDSADQPKKRGRPSKEEVAERDRKLAMEGKIYQPKKRPTKKPRMSLPAETSGSRDEESTTPRPQTPVARPHEFFEESSSGKRRSRRHTRDETPTILPSAGAETFEDTAEVESVMKAESPSDRLLASHRDRGSVGSSLSRRTQQESDILEQGCPEQYSPP